jgi:hypothetical protein
MEPRTLDLLSLPKTPATTAAQRVSTGARFTTTQVLFTSFSAIDLVPYVTRSHVRIPAHFSPLFGIPSKFTFHLHPTAQIIAKHVLHERPIPPTRPWLDRHAG